MLLKPTPEKSLYQLDQARLHHNYDWERAKRCDFFFFCSSNQGESSVFWICLLKQMRNYPVCLVHPENQGPAGPWSFGSAILNCAAAAATKSSIAALSRHLQAAVSDQIKPCRSGWLDFVPEGNRARLRTPLSESDWIKPNLTEPPRSTSIPPSQQINPSCPLYSSDA